jgi:hypothetical protein
MRRGQMTVARCVHIREFVADESALSGVVNVPESSPSSGRLPW